MVTQKQEKINEIQGRCFVVEKQKLLWYDVNMRTVKEFYYVDNF